MRCQRQLFSLPADECYLNGASRSPQLIAAADAARDALKWREHNSGMPIEQFFQPVAKLRKSFARLIGSEEADRVALIPAASYGIATVAKNLPLGPGQEVVVAQDQFPSNYYAWHRRCDESHARLVTVAKPSGKESWSDRILEAITIRTAAVAIAQIHWSDGSVFDLEAIRRRTDEVGAWLVVDGTQSLGAYPFDVKRIRPDALIAGGYKWLLGPYGCGYAWYGPRMDGGVPLEENWINRSGSDDFTRLAAYQSEYRPLAARYSVGEHSNFISIPMQQAGMDLLLSWQAEAVQTYIQQLWQSIDAELDRSGLRLPDGCAYHLVGLRLPDHIQMEALKSALATRKISVSYRGELVRVAPHVYNSEADMEQFAAAIRRCCQTTRT
ncbi:selenocysteine lyase/cysteine desulfurase [Neolewinella xylanilytica]|uniref:Selenocysteine lyase/cysteine desulfurase n=1 Tax=Neolewinella xylanilytica TaxID=1514080 RepID=A0A2S6I039_9BACT|nr:aminotransferase class V-fold PLP-dependent enzyme [Neolewinella xylanilytica]PPK84127.1 selenocysteine lyase/cysteine desulfurase [Neolewinella xylanilytica]